MLQMLQNLPFDYHVVLSSIKCYKTIFLVTTLYTCFQCCNDVVQGRFASELKYDIALRLAALHMQQHAISSNMQGKVTVKAIE